MSIAATQFSSSAFTVGTDLTGEFAPGVRVRADCGTDGILLATVTASTFNATTGLTTVTVALDSGGLTANLASVLHGNDLPDSLVRATTEYVGASELATLAETVAGTDTARVVTVAAARQAVLSALRDSAGLFLGLTPPSLNLFCGSATEDTTPAGTFSRSTIATRRGRCGLVETVAAGSLRREWGADGTLRGWLIEPAATNLLTSSEQLDNATFLKARCSVTANAAAGGDGAMTADKLTEDTTLNTHILYLSPSFSPGDYSFSLFAKQAERKAFATILYATAFGSTVSSAFDLQSGTTSLIAAGTATATGIWQYADGIWRCNITSRATTAASANLQIRLYDAPGGTTSYLGDGASGLSLWGLQLEAGPYPTSYIPTTTTASARAGDVWTIPLATSWFNAAAGTIFLAGRTALGAPVAGSLQVLAQFDDGSASNRIRIVRDENRLLRCLVTAAGTETCNLELGTVADATGLRMAFSWSASGFAASLNGGSVVTATAATLPTGLTTHRIGSDSAGASQWGGHVLHDAYFPVAHPTSRLQAITL